MAAASANPAIQVTAKEYPKDASPEIVNVIETTWKSALHGIDGNRDDKKEIKTKSVGVLDVKMEDQTHVYVIACSSTGLNDIIVAEEAKIARIWKVRKDDIWEKIKALKGLGVSNHIIADVGPSTQCYCALPTTTEVSKFSEDKQEAYWKEIKQRLENRKRELELKFFKTYEPDTYKKLSDVHHGELADLLWESVFGAKFKVDKLPKKDFELLVDWHKDIIEKPVAVTIKDFIEIGGKTDEEVIPYLCDEDKLLKGKENLLKAATDLCPKNKDELKKRLEILGLRHLNEQLNNVLRRNSMMKSDLILDMCYGICFKPNHFSRLADYFAQCAEDNATIALMEYLESNPSKRVASVDWFSTKSSKGDIIVHKPLCAICAIRFKDRLEWLLSSQGKEEMVVHPDTNVNGSPDTNVNGSPDTNFDGCNKIFINNRWHHSISGDTYPTINPFTGNKICDVAKGNEKDVDKAVAAAQEALQPGSLWGTMEASQRGDLLNKLADLIERDSQYLACLETMGNRRSLTDTYLPDVVDCYRYFAWWATTIQGGTLPDGGPFRCFTTEPEGVVGLIISRDFPLLTQAWTLGPALCAGNTVVLKPAEENPLTSLYIASLIAEAGFPPGVVNIVTGGRIAGVAVATNPNINKVVFVGSREVGHQVLSQAGGDSLDKKKVAMMLHKSGADICKTFDLTVSMRNGSSKKVPLSGKGSTIIFVFADADLKDVIEKIVFASYFKFSKDQPLPCTIVEQSIYKEFARRCIDEAKKCNMGEWQFDELAGTILDETDFCVMQIFLCNGTIPPLPNSSPMYDIAAAIFTANVEKAMMVVKGQNASTVWVNCYDAFCHQAPLQGMLVPNRRSPLVHVYHESLPFNIRCLIEAVWKSATTDSNGNVILGNKDTFKDKAIGILDVKMEDQTHLYVIACSLAGQKDLLLEETANFASIWKDSMERISMAIDGLNLRVNVKYVIAPIGPFMQRCCAVPGFDDKNRKAYRDAIKCYMQNRREMLRNKFDRYPRGELVFGQRRELKKFLKNSVFGVDDYKLFNWHQKLIEEDNMIEAMLYLMEHPKPKEYVRYFRDKLFPENELTNMNIVELEEKMVMLLEADQCQFDMQYNRLGLRDSDKELNKQFNLKSPKNFIIYRFCDHYHSRTKLADYFAQCAEDNATIALMEYLKNNYPSKKVASVDWFSTQWSEDGTIVPKPLCGVCAIRFKDCLELLLLMSSRDIKYNKIFIKNTWHDSTSGDTYSIINPSTGEKICDVAMGNKEDVDFAVAAAHKALQPGSLWGTMEASQRGHLLNTLADLIERDSEYLACLEAMNSGRPIRDVGRDQPHVISCYRYFAEQTASQKTHEPVAIVGHIIYGDFPLLMQAWVLGSTLCRGNTVILKPAEQTPLSSLYVASLTAEAGFPPGVVSILPGVGSTVGDAMKKHPDISFTGHPNVHKNPIIVFADADLDYAIENSLFIITVGPEGQCIRPHTSVYETFVRRSVEKAKMIKVGNPLDPANDRGPLVGEDQLDKTVDLIKSAVKGGAKLQCGGKRHGDKGYFIEPTILSDVMEHMQVAREETFGPVMLIMKFKTNEEVISRINNPIYNSNCNVFTTNDETKTQFRRAVDRMRRGGL